MDYLFLYTTIGNLMSLSRLGSKSILYRTMHATLGTLFKRYNIVRVDRHVKKKLSFHAFAIYTLFEAFKGHSVLLYTHIIHAFSVCINKDLYIVIIIIWMGLRVPTLYNIISRLIFIIYIFISYNIVRLATG